MFLLKLHPLPAFLLINLTYFIGQSLMLAPVDQLVSAVTRAIGVVAVLAYPAFVCWRLSEHFGDRVPFKAKRMLSVLGCAALIYGPVPTVLAFTNDGVIPDPNQMHPAIGLTAVALLFAPVIYVCYVASECVWQAEAVPPLKRRYEVLTFLTFAALPLGILVLQKRLRRILS